jgi:protein-tyrosine phosphatase
MGGVRIVAVCTANICRSPSTAVLLRRGLESVLPDAEVTSAGVAALTGRPVCDLSAALTQRVVAELGGGAAARTADDLASHRSRQLRQEDLQAAGLVLTLDRSHRSEVARLHPAGRPRTFTLRQAAAAAQLIGQALEARRLPAGAPAIPSDPADRFGWWVEELDAARPFLGRGEQETWQKISFDPDDVPDPHVVGYGYHPQAADAIVQAVDGIVASLRLLMESGGGADSPTLAERNGEAP